MGPSKDLVEQVRAWIANGASPRPDNPHQAKEFADAAVRHGLIAWLDDALAGNALSDWPEVVLADLRASHRRALYDTVQRHALARRVQDFLSARGLRSLPLKGTALADTYYPSPAHRPMADVDVLALERPSDARDALRDAGFTEIAVADHAWSLQDPEGAGVLELHHSVTSCPGLFPLGVESLWSRRRETSSGLVIPSAEHLVVHLALHAAFQHGLVLSIVQYLDFRRLLERPLDAALLRAEADAAGARVALGLALRAARAVVRAPVAPELEALLPPGPAWLEARLRQPTSLLEPSRPDLVRVRWTAARGRRLTFLRSTLAGPPRMPEVSPWRGAWQRLVRIARLAPLTVFPPKR